MLPGQPRLRSSQRQLNAVLFKNEFCFHGNFKDECAHVWRELIERFHLENFILIQRDRCGGGSVLIFDKIGHIIAKQTLSK
jgi:hypothetical protein